MEWSFVFISHGVVNCWIKPDGLHLLMSVAFHLNSYLSLVTGLDHSWILFVSSKYMKIATRSLKSLVHLRTNLFAQVIFAWGSASPSLWLFHRTHCQQLSHLFLLNYSTPCGNCCIFVLGTKQIHKHLVALCPISVICMNAFSKIMVVQLR